MSWSVLTKASALSKQLNENEATKAALLENLGALHEALKIKEQALAECSKQLWNASEAIRIHPNQGNYCEMTMFTTQDEARSIR